MKKMLTVLGVAIVMICGVFTVNASAIDSEYVDNKCVITIEPELYDDLREKELPGERTMLNVYLTAVENYKYDNLRFESTDGKLVYFIYNDDNTLIGGGWVDYDYCRYCARIELGLH